MGVRVIETLTVWCEECKCSVDLLPGKPSKDRKIERRQCPDKHWIETKLWEYVSASEGQRFD